LHKVLQTRTNKGVTILEFILTKCVEGDSLEAILEMPGLLKPLEDGAKKTTMQLSGEATALTRQLEMIQKGLVGCEPEDPLRGLGEFLEKCSGTLLALGRHVNEVGQFSSGAALQGVDLPRSRRRQSSRRWLVCSGKSP
jgi:hypothetical protein